MATSKAFTDLEQSKKLAEILPVESADMYYWCGEDLRVGGHKAMDIDFDVPCWSLAALYSILSNNKKESTTLSRGGWKIDPIEYLDNWWCEYEDNDHTKDFSVSADNPIDACYEMILKLKEMKKL